MSTASLAPYTYSPLELRQIDSLAHSLLHWGEDSSDPKVKKLVRSHDYSLPSSSSSTPTKVKSWNLNEFAYKRDPCPFPTRARGLFTQEVDEKVELGKGRYRIVARGYDKFFNVGEVGWTKVRSLHTH